MYIHIDNISKYIVTDTDTLMLKADYKPIADNLIINSVHHYYIWASYTVNSLYYYLQQSLIWQQILLKQLTEQCKDLNAQTHVAVSIGLWGF